MAFLPAPRTSTPRRNIAWTSALRSSTARSFVCAIAHQLDADHQALAADVADERVLLLQRAQAVDQVRPDGWRRSRPARPCSSAIVAFAAAHETGLPPNVLACAPGGHDITSARAQVTPSGSPDAMPFAMLTMSARQAEVLAREHLPGAAHPRLHLVDDQQHAVLRGQLAQPLQERRRRHDVAALALDRLDDDGGDFVGRRPGGRGSDP